jgi:thiol-disulfide isomerase/thioredoxin
MIKAVLFSMAAVFLILGLHPVFTQTLAAQSTADIPIFGSPPKDIIRSLNIINRQEMPVLQDRVIVVAFFASWCPPCRPEFAELNTVRRAFSGDDVSVIAINRFENHFPDSSGARMKRFLRTTGPEFTVIEPNSDEVIKRIFGDISRIPTVYVYDRAGHPVYSFIHQQGATKMHTKAADIMPHINRALSR